MMSMVNMWMVHCSLFTNGCIENWRHIGEYDVPLPLLSADDQSQQIKSTIEYCVNDLVNSILMIRWNWKLLSIADTPFELLYFTWTWNYLHSLVGNKYLHTFHQLCATMDTRKRKIGAQFCCLVFFLLEIRHELISQMAAAGCTMHFAIEKKSLDAHHWSRVGIEWTAVRAVQLKY